MLAHKGLQVLAGGLFGTPTNQTAICFFKCTHFQIITICPMTYIYCCVLLLLNILIIG